MLMMLARAARQKHSITGVELLCMLWFTGRQMGDRG